jgi:hypothetical protein
MPCKFPVSVFRSSLCFGILVQFLIAVFDLIISLSKQNIGEEEEIKNLAVNINVSLIRRGSSKT